MVIGSSAASTTVGLDVNVSGNQAFELGPIDECVSMANGATVEVDLWVKDVEGLQAFDSWFSFDPDHVTVTAYSSAFMVTGLGTTSDPTPNSSGTHFGGGASTTPNSGEGVLARYTLALSGSGITELKLESPAPDQVDGVSLNYGTDPLPEPAVLGARIAIGVPCTPATPSPTPSPRPSPSPSPTPEPTEPPTPVPTGPTPTDSNPGGGTPTPTQAPVTPSPTPITLPDNDRQDTDCDGFLTGQDLLRILMAMAGIDTNIQDCPDVGTIVQGGYFGDYGCFYGLDEGDIFTALHKLAGFAPFPC